MLRRICLIPKSLVALTLFLLLTSTVIAQVSGSGTITGTITDPSGAAVPGAGDYGA